MCGLFGIVAVAGAAPSLDDVSAARLRDLLTHRGPDGAGLWRRDNALLTHRRLAVLDTSDAGAQPMVSQRGRIAMVYNGELYNDHALRGEILELDPRPFRSVCDSETVLRALELWGTRAVERFRGMFALAWFDTREQRLYLARDPFGMKPLYYFIRAREALFASEPRPILAHPAISPAPNLEMVSAYLTTIRTVLGEDTLYEGVRAVAPGSLVTIDVSGAAPAVESDIFWRAPSVGGIDLDADNAAELVRAAVEDSVVAHLRADVPTCALLSGGLDSTITTMIARERMPDLRTYCAGAESDSDDDDLFWARLASAELGVRHEQAIVSRARFTHRWPAMVRELGSPLSTPNEVAINAVAQRLRADGCIVTISGEGADELFAGYEGQMDEAFRFCAVGGHALTPGSFQLESNAWVHPAMKPALLRERVWEAASRDAPLRDRYDDIFGQCEDEAGDAAGSVEAHLRFHARVNLTGLLQRLDTATMLASVEGRAPFADARVADAAWTIPIMRKFDFTPAAESDGAVATAVRTRSKLVLRSAFASRVPVGVLERPKASFPLPFNEWMADLAPTLRRSLFARSIFTDAAIATVAADPASHWNLAWPMMNLAIWGDAMWG